MTQTEITARCPALDAKGNLASPGWARHLYFDYDAKAVKASPFALKEWDFYQISDERWVLQLTLGHVSYASSVSAMLFDLTTGELHNVGVMAPFPMQSMGMDKNGEMPHTLCYKRGKLDMRYEVTETERHLTFSAEDKKEGHVSIDVTLQNGSPSKDKLVIATPFEAPGHFYLNYKENCCPATGTARFGEREVAFGKGAYGLMDWGRGVWPFRHEWIWANGSGEAEGKLFGFNFGWGFGDTSRATENIFFFDNRGYKLGRITEEVISGDGYMATKRYRDEDGLFDLTAEPIFDHYTETKVLFVDNSCHQVHSRWSGSVTADGRQIPITGVTAFCEHAVNRW